MGAVRLFMSMSLDGFADRNGGDKEVQVIGGADVAQQLINAGLLDEIQISFIPLLLGDGLRLFEHIGSEHRQLETIKVNESPGRTDIRYRVLR